LFSDGSCEKLHGHNYRVSVETAITGLEMGLACPFQKLKTLIEKAIRPLDEMVLMPTENPWVTLTSEGGQTQVHIKTPRVIKFYSLPASEVFLLEDENVSSECLARYLFHAIKKHFQAESLVVQLRSVCVLESSGQEVCYSEDSA